MGEMQDDAIGTEDLESARPEETQLPTALGLHLIGKAEQRAKLFAAKAKARGAMPSVKRSKTVTVRPKKRDDGYQPPPYTFDYAPLESILEAAIPALTAEGLDFYQFEAGGCITSVITHATGGMMVHVTAIHDFRRVGDIKGYGSAVTYARRYSAAPLIGISAEDDDDGNAAAGASVEGQQQRQPAQRQQKRRTAPEPEKAAPKTEAKQAPSPPKSEPPPSPKPEVAGVTEATRDEIRALFPVLQKSGKAPAGNLLADWLKEHCQQHLGKDVHYLRITEEQAQTWLAALRETAK